MTFDRIAPYYDGLTRLVFGRRLQRAQTVFLDQIPARASVLIVGGGTGWLIEQVLTHGRANRILYLESSGEMLARASGRMVRKAVLGSVEFRLGNETALRSDEHFDVIMTPFVLDLFGEETLRTRMIPGLQRALQSNGVWFVTDFDRPAEWWQKTLVWAMIRFFRLTSDIEARHLTDWQRLLAEAGLARKRHQQQVGGLVATGVWQHEPDTPTIF